MELFLCDEQIVSSTYSVEEGDSLLLGLACFSSFPSATIDVHVKANAKFVGAFADFGEASGSIFVNVYLDGEGAECEFHGASLSNRELNKTISTSCFHKAPHTNGLMENYGIAEDNSRLVFTGVSQIEKGSVESSTRQSAKIIIFDPKCVGKCSPILKISENDVSASHAAVVGKLNEDHIFYLTSRGISRADARRLITLGYLKPVEAFFPEDLQTKIDKAIEGGL